MKFIFAKQLDNMDCGPTCLKMVVRSYGKNINMARLRNLCKKNDQGVNLLGISEAAEAIGFSADGFNLSLDELNKIKLPAILHWNHNHFVVLFRIANKRYHIADPGKSIVRLTEKEFVEKWSYGNERGSALVLEPLPSFGDLKEDPYPSNWIFFKKYIVTYRKLILQISMGVILGNLLQLFFPFLTAALVDRGIKDSNFHLIYLILIAQAALLIGRTSVNFFRSWLLFHLSARINISILAQFLSKVMRLPIGFFLSKTTGDIMQRINDQDRIEKFLTGPALNIMFSFGNFLIFSAIILYYNYTLFFVSLAGMGVYSIWVLLFLKRRRALNYNRFDLSAKSQNHVMQLLDGIKDIKLSNSERVMRWAWERTQVNLFDLEMKGIVLNQTQEFGVVFINEGKNIILSFLSARAVILGDMTLGSMVALQYIMGQLNSPIEQMILFIQELQEAKISWERLNEVQQLEDEFSIGGKTVAELPAGKNIHIRNLFFSYPGAGNPAVFEDLNLTIPFGKTTAIVGKSGCGKTTIINLLLQFYSPDQGDIRIGDVSLSDVDPRSWREECGVVMQDGYIFSDTILKNIAVGAEDVDDAAVRNAIHIANLSEFIEELPLGLQTVIGPGGIGISQGQKQRILIARVAYKNPHYIFFDEATNSLDSENESTIMNNLNKFFKGKTAVIIAHRLSTVFNADKIIVVNKGRIPEVGSHRELIALKGEYYSLVKSQLELEV